jgi:hypothetical protein
VPVLVDEDDAGSLRGPRKSSLAKPGRNSEALAGAGGGSVTTDAEPSMTPAKGDRSLVDGLSAGPHRGAETLSALRCLRREAEERIEQLINLLDDIEGDPDSSRTSPAEPDLSG